jgi:PleD family two-component response regulator
MEDQKAFLLIVDDNPVNIQVLGNMLEDSGYRTAATLSGNDALKFIKEEKPDLILLDIMMPEIDGFQICKKIKKGEDTKDIPVIFLTAKNDTESIVRGFDVGGVDYISKPYHSAELLARIKTHLELKHAREEIISLRGIIPICASCKKIRNDEGFWASVETYLETHTDARFSHGICPDCEEELYGDNDWFKKMKE